MGEEIAITFQTLYDLLMREKQRDELLQLEPTFFQDVVQYMQEKVKVWERVKQDNDLFSIGESEKIESEIKSIRKVLKDLYERREKKILEMALNRSRVGQAVGALNMLDEEKHFFEAVVSVLDRYRHGTLMNLLRMEMPKVEEHKVVVEFSQAGGQERVTEQKPRETALIKFIHPVPKFVGSDLAIYGPFDQGDIASIPKDVAEILVNKKRAEAVRKE